MPNYDYKCERKHRFQCRLTFAQFDRVGRGLPCPVCVTLGNPRTLSQPVIQPVQFTIKPGWWDDEADRKQANLMMRGKL